MIILTDDAAYSKKYFDHKNKFTSNYSSDTISDIKNEFLKSKDCISYYIKNNFWNYGVVTQFAENSQFDSLIKLSNNNKYIPDRSFYLAGSGKNFHGFRNRKWETIEGNIHFTCYLSPNIHAFKAGMGFTMLAAVSVVDTLDSLAELKEKSKIKWVNDIVVDNSKICGVIAQTQIQGSNITDAYIGIGLNVEAVPKIESTSFVPTATSISSYIKNRIDISEICNILLENIYINYDKFLKNGVEFLLEKYLSRSIIIGREIEVWSDPVQGNPLLINRGVVESIGKFLELFIKGQKQPVTDGRVVLI